MKRYLINSIENMRDLGGYKVWDKTTRYGKLIRSNFPRQLTSEGVSFLKNIGINTVVDFRSRKEVLAQPSPIELKSDFRFYHLEITGGERVPPSPMAVAISYMQMLDATGVIQSFFSLMSDPQTTGILFYSDLGKDRAGVISALILMALGVPEEDIINDYMLSAVYLDDILRYYERISLSDEKAVLVPKEIYMERFFNLFKRQYRSIDFYLNRIGISSSKIQEMKNYYLE